MRYIFLAGCVSLMFSLQGQERFCQTTEAMNQWFAEHPEAQTNYEKLSSQSAQEDAAAFAEGYHQYKNAQKKLSQSTFTIPVVFHILHTGGFENISDAQVQDAVQILTRDFNRLNADTSNVVHAFKNLIGDASIAFALATRDPNGQCTNGILRHWDANTDWHGNYAQYKYSWPSNQYLNIYVVRSIGGNAAAYTYLPGSGIPSAMDAIVTLSGYVGSIGTGAIFKSRVLTHEVGHWLGLPHTWGMTNSPGIACGDDGISDTPLTKGFTSCLLQNSAVCNATVQENVQNYMEYSYCDNMFTIGQAYKMQSVMNGTVSGRNNLSSHTNLIATGVLNPLSGCQPKIDILASPGSINCAGKTIAFNSFTWNAVPSSYLWSAGNSAQISSPNSASTSISFAFTGTYVVSCTAVNPQGSATAYSVIVIKDGTPDIIGGGSESFEKNTLPANWTVVNQNTTNVSWELNSDASSHGVQSMVIAGDKLPANAIEILEGPSYDFKNNQGGLFTFKYAYARGSNNNKDIFKVQASTDCGGTWQDWFYPGNWQMSTGSGEISNIPFVPTDEAWKFYNLSSHPNFKNFKNESGVRVRFFFQEDPGGTGFGNRLYIDEINFNSPTGVNELTRQTGFAVYPNPAQGEINFSYTLSSQSTVSSQVVNVTGGVVKQHSETNQHPGNHTGIYNVGDLPAGLYFLNLEVNGTRLSTKVIVQ